MQVRLFVLASLLVAPAAAAQTTRSDSAAVIAFIRAYDAAWTRKDTAVVAARLMPEFRYFSSTGSDWSKARLLELLSSPAYRVEYSERSEVEARIVSSTAIVSTRWKGRGSWSGGTFDDDQRCSIVLVKHRGTWGIVAEHCTQIKAAGM